ncbi:MAG TPA: hypothetical protein PLE28_01785 [bacterium]|nr:hypothetical protein [bacterium]
MKFLEKNKKQETKTTPKPEIDLIIHRMPKGYKTGRFESKQENKNGIKNVESNGGKKIGVVIIVVGIIIVLFLAYVIFSYITKPNFSFSNLFKFSKTPVIEKTVDNTNKNIIENTEVINNENELEEIIDIATTSSTTATTTEIEDINNEPENSTTTDIINYTSIDSDSDGLNDDEEFILGSDFSKADSDADSYNDLVEVLSLYNPTGSGNITNNINITKYKNDAFAYSVLYPNIWGKSALSDGSSLILSIDSGSFIQILVEPNTSNFSIKNWYADRFFVIVSDADIIKNSSWEGIYSSDGLALYLTDKERKNVYTILYNTTNGQKNYLNIFEMIIKSFSLN